MNWIDIAVIAIVAVMAMPGIQRGFLHGAIDLITLAISVAVAAYGYEAAAGLLAGLFNRDSGAWNVVGFILVAMVAQIVLSMLTSLVLAPLIQAGRKLAPIRWVDGLLGLVPGAFKGVLLSTALVLALTLLPVGNQLDRNLADSALGSRLLSGATGLTYEAQDRTGIDLSDFTILTAQPGGEGYRLPYAIDEGLVVSEADEERMIALVNEERARNGLPALTFDPALRDVAREHSTEMVSLGYFAHESPVAGSPSDRLVAAGVPFGVAGENLAFAPSVEIAHRSLMRSEGHRENILSPRYQRIGVGVIVTPYGSKMFTQEFTGD